jgi:hypothetical protein
MKYVLPVLVLLLLLDASPAKADCTCRAFGRDFQTGESVCLRSPSGQSRLATCGMVLNNSAWQFTDTPCVSSRRMTPAKIASLLTN